MMPHDRKGRKIDLGDVIITKPYNQNTDEPREYVGVVVQMKEAQNCTGRIVFQSAFEGNKEDYFGAEDSLLVLKANGDAVFNDEPTFVIM